MADIVHEEPGALMQISQLEYDREISTAHAFPRSVGRATDDIMKYATVNEDVAAECGYAIPRGGKVIMGPSVRLAEIVGTCWGNARYASRLLEEKQNFVVAQAVFHDLEKNIRVSIEVARSIVGSRGRYDTDMIGVTSQAAMSIALRNVIFKGVPRFVWGDAYAKSQAMVAGTIETLDKRRTTALDQFVKLGATNAMVLQLLNRDHVKDIEPNDLLVLRGVLVSLRDGETSFRSIFGAMESSGASKKADIGGALNRGREAERTSQNAQGGRGDQHQDSAPGGEAVSEGRPDVVAGSDPAAQADTGRAAGSADQSSATREPAGGNGAADQAGAAAALIPSLKLDEQVDKLFGGETCAIEEEWMPKMNALIEAFRKANSTNDLNALWDKMANTFESAPDDVAKAQQALRSARGKDIRAAANKSAAAAKL